MSEVCGDNRLELIGEFKGKLVEGTNIETSPEEMAVLDNILFRFWQMGWLDKLKAQEPLKPVPDTSYGARPWWFLCGNCKLSVNEDQKYCPNCGREVKWE